MSLKKNYVHEIVMLQLTSSKIFHQVYSSKANDSTLYIDE